LVFSFGVGGAAMFAEPAVTEIEEVVGLIQKNQGTRGQRTEVRESEIKSRVGGPHLLTSDF
jgi:hypothetical protein